MRKRVLVLLGLLACLCVFISLLLPALWTEPRYAIGGDSADRIQIGMTVAEVEAVLGVPAGSGTVGRADTLYAALPAEYLTGKQMLERFGGREWVGDLFCIWVGFDDNGRVNHKLMMSDPAPESWLTKLRRRLGF
jgi:hypothetical protein